MFLALTALWEGAHAVTFHVALLHQRSAPSTNLHALSISQPAIQTSAKIKGKTERMYPYLWILFSSNYSYCYEFLFLCLGDCLHMCSPQWGWWNTAADRPESLWDLHPWMQSKPDWTRSPKTSLTLTLALSWVSLVNRDGPDDLQSSLLTYIMIHWYYNLGQFQARCHRLAFIKQQITGAFIRVSIWSPAQSLTENTVDRLFSKALANINQSWHNALVMSTGFE